MPLPHAKRTHKNGAVVIDIDGTLIDPVAYFCPAPTVERITSMRRAGISLISWGWGRTIAHCNELGWKAPGEYDYSQFDEQVALILEHHPDAWLFPRVAVAAPQWWLDANPQHNAIMSTGKARGLKTGRTPANTRDTTVSLASDVWQKAMEDAIARLIAHFAAQPYAERIIGLQPTGGVNEWFVSHGLDFPDYGPESVRAFREWLRERYTTDSELADAWQMDISLETAQPPLPDILKQGTWGGLFDPAQGTQVPDWWRFYHALNAHRIIETCEAIKRASEGRMLTGAFHGYLPDSYSSNVGAAWLWGHHDMRTVRDHPAVDYLAAPYQYRNRELGGTPESQILTTSLGFAGKFSFTENDGGTFLRRFIDGRTQIITDRADDSPYTRRKTFQNMIRDHGQRLIRREGFWWMDLQPPENWYTHPQIEALIRRLHSIHKAQSDRPASKVRAQICVVIDEESVFHTQVGHAGLASLVANTARQMMPYVGAPFDLLLHNDLERDDLPDYRLYVFLDTIMLTTAERAAIRRRLAGSGAVALWHWLPGLIDEKEANIQHVSELIGIELGLISGGPIKGQKRYATARFSNFSHPAAQGIMPSYLLGGERYDAIPFVVDEDAEILARHNLKARPAAVIKSQPDGWTSAYLGLPLAPVQFIRNLAQMADVHLFSQQDAVIDACDDLILVHHAGDGPLAIQLPRPVSRAANAITGEPLTLTGQTITIDSTVGTSHLIALEPDWLPPLSAEDEALLRDLP